MKMSRRMVHMLHLAVTPNDFYIVNTVINLVFHNIVQSIQVYYPIEMIWTVYFGWKNATSVFGRSYERLPGNDFKCRMSKSGLDFEFNSTIWFYLYTIQT